MLWNIEEKNKKSSEIATPGIKRDVPMTRLAISLSHNALCGLLTQRNAISSQLSYTQVSDLDFEFEFIA